MKRLLALLGLSLIGCWLSVAFASPSVVVVPLKGPIGPASAEFVSDSIDKAEDMAADLVVIEIDTPGGLLTSTRELIQAIVTSITPVVTYVAPSGARATSAGTFIMYASHIAAMAPGTHVGAASPVALGGGSQPKQADAPPSTMEKKVMSDSTAYIRSLAQMRGRNAEWAELAVTEAKSLSAEEALKLGVINLIAPSLDDLIQQLNGQSVKVQGKAQTLALDASKITVLKPTLRQQILATITHPSIALVLVVIGFIGLYVEYSQPGMIIPGVIGVVALLVAGYALHILPINYIGLGLLILGIILWATELVTGGFGLLAVGGTISFIVGALILFDKTSLGYAVPLGTILGIAVSGALITLMIIRLAWSSHRRPVVMADYAVIGHIGIIKIRQNDYWVKVSGEWWRAKSDQALSEGDRVKITAMSDLVVTVERINQSNTELQGD